MRILVLHNLSAAILTQFNDFDTLLTLLFDVPYKCLILNEGDSLTREYLRGIIQYIVLIY